MLLLYMACVVIEDLRVFYRSLVWMAQYHCCSNRGTEKAGVQQYIHHSLHFLRIINLFWNSLIEYRPIIVRVKLVSQQ